MSELTKEQIEGLAQYIISDLNLMKKLAEEIAARASQGILEKGWFEVLDKVVASPQYQKLSQWEKDRLSQLFWWRVEQALDKIQ